MTSRNLALFATLVSVIFLSIGYAASVPNAEASTISTCKFSSLEISATNGDGLHHGVELMVFKNVSSKSCTLRGYPVTEAVLISGKTPKNLIGMYHASPPGSTLRAKNVEIAWAGGVGWSSGIYPTPAEQRAFVPPVIVLKAKTGTASSTLNWVDGPNTGTCPAFAAIRIGLTGKFVTRQLGLNYDDPLCYEFAVTPFVRGSTGAMTVKSTSKTNS